MEVSFVARRLTTLAVLLTLAIALPGHSAVARDAFQHDLSQVSAELNDDLSYRRLPLEGPDDQRWFTDLAYSLYKNEINAAQWIVYDALYAYCRERTRVA